MFIDLLEDLGDVDIALGPHLEVSFENHHQTTGGFEKFHRIFPKRIP